MALIAIYYKNNFLTYFNTAIFLIFFMIFMMHLKNIYKEKGKAQKGILKEVGYHNLIFIFSIFVSILIIILGITAIIFNKNPFPFGIVGLGLISLVLIYILSNSFAYERLKNINAKRNRK